MKYTGINIGPIIPTISMGRRPREIWAASYMFSFLMQCIIEKIKYVAGIEIISPATLETDAKIGVGLYPDRIFVQGELDTEKIIDEALKQFESLTGVSKEYVNVMYATIEANEGDKESPIKRLNQLLDTTELCKRPTTEESRQSAIGLVTKGYESPLHVHAFGKLGYHIPFLAEIATDSLSSINSQEWKALCNDFREIKSEKEASKGEDDFYNRLKRQLKDGVYGNDEKFFSYYKYICIVQADGDNMGKIVSAASTDKVKAISKSLLNYGQEACKKIKAYGGLPIYAGGDDLLFIAPVRSTDKTIFELIDEIDKLYKDEVDSKIEDDSRPDGLHTYLSYGLSITYYKYPLYEAFKNAIDLLFTKAKNIKEKNAISWQLRKHSGTGFVGELTKAMPAGACGKTPYSLLKEISTVMVDEKLISAIAHKLKANEALLEIMLNKFRNDRNEADLNGRIENFYKKFMEESDGDRYKALTRELLCRLMTEADSETKIATILENMYGILRTAKFIKGEGDKDE